MISHKYKCIFIHVPRVAGQSIETFFLRLHNLDWKKRSSLLLRPNDNQMFGPPRLAHLKAHEYLKYEYISKDLFDNYYKFSFVRNPWSRTVSIYKYLYYNTMISFKKFVEKVLPKFLKEQDKKYFYGPQYDYIYHHNKKMVDFVGRFETINEDFKKLCKDLNISNANLPHVNKSKKSNKKSTIKEMFNTFKNQPKFIFLYSKLIFQYSKEPTSSKDYRKYYDKNLIQRIHDLYYKDIETFDYSFETR